jgi:hypothetical protein
MRRDSGRLDRLERMVLELHEVLLVESAGGEAVGAVTSGSNGPVGEARVDRGLVALPEGNRYHRSSCPMVQHKSQVAAVTASMIQRRHLDPCNMCDPAVVGV